MARDIMKRLCKVYIRQGRDKEALEYLVNEKGFDEADAKNYILDIKEIVDKEPND